MNKPEILSKMVEFGSQSKVEAERNLESFCKVLEYCVENKEELKLQNYFVMEVKEYAAKKGRNPATKEIVMHPATKRVKFNVKKILKELALK